MTVHVVGNLNLDIILGPLDPWPPPGTETILPDNALRAGGAAANAALALHALGTPVQLHADVGDDPFGDVLLRELAPLGEAARTVRRVPWPTAYSVGITHVGDERTFFTFLGHLAHFDPAGLNAALRRSQGDILLVCGYFLVPGMRGGRLQATLRIAEAQNHAVALDTGWPSEGWTDAVREELSALLPHVGLVLPNAGELAGWTARSQLEPALAALEAQGPRAVAKLGAEGAAWLDAGTLRRAPSPAARVADTVGAGDAFNAGLLAALQRGLPLEDAVRAGTRTAALAIASDPRRYPAWAELGMPSDPGGG